MAKKYSSNNVYILEIHGCQYYVGCHARQKEMTEAQILWSSGNQLRRAQHNGLITTEEYKECCRLIHIEEYDTSEEALNREVELIQKFKEQYGSNCLNQALGNKIGSKGVVFPEYIRKKVSEGHKGQVPWNKGIFLPEEHKKRCAEGRGIQGILQYSLDGEFIAEYSSIHEAARQTGILLSAISNCCNGYSKSAGKSIFKKKEKVA